MWGGGGGGSQGVWGRPVERERENWGGDLYDLF